ncbi:MAG: heme-binding beta-barrel domain-containing protein [Gammaproteobacteria bacterium]
MRDNEDIDYGPLAGLVGEWKGDKGLDVAPEPDGAEHNPYYETITFTPVGDVTNAECQNLAALYYRQIVRRLTDGKVFHDETGYWMWDAEAGIVMHSLTIPRGVCLLAGGVHNGTSQDDGTWLLKVSAALENNDWAIVQSRFMSDNARTLSFEHCILLSGDRLEYEETTMVQIYGNTFEHTDRNVLQKQLSV